MRYVCPECGSQIDEDSDFCHVCGCLKSKAYAVGEGTAEGVCPRCGNETLPGELFCGRCGYPLKAQPPFSFSKRSVAAMMLALIPGFFSVYGLGHLVMKEWVRGAMFLAMTALYWYMRMGAGSNGILIILLSVALYIYQASDLFRVIMARGLGNERLDGEIPPRHVRRRRWKPICGQYAEDVGEKLVVRDAFQARRGAHGLPRHRQDDLRGGSGQGDGMGRRGDERL